MYYYIASKYIFNKIGVINDPLGQATAWFMYKFRNSEMDTVSDLFCNITV